MTPSLASRRRTESLWALLVVTRYTWPFASISTGLCPGNIIVWPTSSLFGLRHSTSLYDGVCTRCPCARFRHAHSHTQVQRRLLYLEKYTPTPSPWYLPMPQARKSHQSKTPDQTIRNPTVHSSPHLSLNLTRPSFLRLRAVPHGSHHHPPFDPQPHPTPTSSGSTSFRSPLGPLGPLPSLSRGCRKASSRRYSWKRQWYQTLAPAL